MLTFGIPLPKSTPDITTSSSSGGGSSSNLVVVVVVVVVLVVVAVSNTTDHSKLQRVDSLPCGMKMAKVYTFAIWCCR